MMKSVEYWISNLNLQTHPEGGFFAETYRSDEEISNDALPERYDSGRCFSTSIFFLLTRDTYSKFHKLKSDEIWHYNYGGKLNIYCIEPDGKMTVHSFGPDIDKGDKLQFTIPKNTWFAAEVSEGEYVLLSCTVAPGFDFDDFELADTTALIETFPLHSNIISQYS